MMQVRTLMGMAGILALAACSQPAPISYSPPPPPPAPLDAAAACLRDLTQMNIQYQPVQPFGQPDGGCGIDNPVKMSGAAIPWNRPAVLSCDLARTMAIYERDVIQPLAQKHFGQPIARLHQAGTYDCRMRRNNSKGGRLSEHAKGLAIDVTVFELADGTTVSVKNDWRSAGKKSAFLRELGRASCQSFKVVLTPNHDKLHHDHFHLDVGPYTLCGN